MILELKDVSTKSVIILQDLDYDLSCLDFDKDSARPLICRDASVQLPDYFLKYYYQVTEGDLRYFINGENQGLRVIHSKSGELAARYISDIAGKLMLKFSDWLSDVTVEDRTEDRAGNAISTLKGLWIISKAKPYGVWDCIT